MFRLILGLGVYSVEFSEDAVHALGSHPHVQNVEADSEMRTQ